LYLTRTVCDALASYTEELAQVNSTKMDVSMSNESAHESPGKPEGDSAAEPLYRLIRKIRPRPTFRELIASCLRSTHMGDPFSDDGGALPPLPENVMSEVQVREIAVGDIRCLIYSPTANTRKLPLMLYMHGGGFVIGDCEDVDYTARSLCFFNQIVVASVGYRLAPETVFPGQIADCEQVLKSLMSQHAELNIDVSSLYVAGDSAGGNLAAALCHLVHPQQLKIKGLIMLAPWLDMELEAYESYNRLAPTGIVFDAAFLAYARAAYVGFEQWKNPLVSPIHCSFVDMPPTIAFIGTEDPLLDQVLKLKNNALLDGCESLEVQVYSHMPHCFYSFPNLFLEEADCYKRISDFICKTL
jgi:acetyl esterase